MARNALISEPRYKRILKRQSETRWFEEYMPAMLATRDEAPTISRPATVYVSKLGRRIHMMSQAERHMAVLALYHPHVIDLHEQFMLHPFDAPHPLEGLPQAANMSLPRLRGTVSVADEMGMVSKHQVIWLGAEGQETRHAFPYLGDFLLFLTDDQGPFCVNWSIKATRSDFFDPTVKVNKASDTLSQTRSYLRFRHEMERQYFADVDIPTHFIAADEFDKTLLQNLHSLFIRAQQRSQLTQEQHDELALIFERLVGTQTTVLSQLSKLTKMFHCERTECLIALYQAVWNRRVRVDLYRPILADKPLKAERSDILATYAHLFGRK